MKSLNKKLAFTLIELIVSMIISGILFLIIFRFIVDSLNELSYSNSKTILVNDVFSFRNKLNRFIKSGYVDISEIGDSKFNTLLLKDVYSSKGLLFGVVNNDTLKLQKDYVYGKNLLGYRLLSQTEINNIELDNNEIYNLDFYLDKLYKGILVKNFDVELYNSGTILDLNLSTMYKLNESYVGEYFTGITIEKDKYMEFNLNF